MVTGMAPRIARLAGVSVLQLAALVLAHQLVFAVRYGSRYGEQLVHSGHGEAWTAAVLTSAAMAVGLAVIALVRIAHLGLLVRRRAAQAHARQGYLAAGTLLRTWLRTAPRMAVLSTLLLTIQENLERSAIGQPAPGPGVLLSPEYPGGLLITIAVALAVSLVAALYLWRRNLLLARLRAVRTPLPRAAQGAPARPGVGVRAPVKSILGRRSALRAPPLEPTAA